MSRNKLQLVWNQCRHHLSQQISKEIPHAIGSRNKEIQEQVTQVSRFQSLTQKPDNRLNNEHRCLTCSVKDKEETDIIIICGRSWIEQHALSNQSFVHQPFEFMAGSNFSNDLPLMLFVLKTVLIPFDLYFFFFLSPVNRGRTQRRTQITWPSFFSFCLFKEEEVNFVPFLATFLLPANGSFSSSSWTFSNRDGHTCSSL